MLFEEIYQGTLLLREMVIDPSPMKLLVLFYIILLIIGVPTAYILKGSKRESFTGIFLGIIFGPGLAAIPTVLAFMYFALVSYGWIGGFVIMPFVFFFVPIFIVLVIGLILLPILFRRYVLFKRYFLRTTGILFLLTLIITFILCSFVSKQ